MTAPDMAAITESLERSLRQFSLSNQDDSPPRTGVSGPIRTLERSSSTSDDNIAMTESQIPIELNSHLSLPHQWEQCLDLKTGEIYYRNLESGEKTTDDPRLEGYYNRRSFVDSECDSSYESEESSTESPPLSSRMEKEKHNSVLVVAGCKTCFMYFMVPKLVEDCPKCSGQLLHFDRASSPAPSP